MAAVDVRFRVVPPEHDRPIVVGESRVETPKMPQNRSAIEARDVIGLVQYQGPVVAFQCLLPAAETLEHRAAVAQRVGVAGMERDRGVVTGQRCLMSAE